MKKEYTIHIVKANIINVCVILVSVLIFSLNSGIFLNVLYVVADLLAIYALGYNMLNRVRLNIESQNVTVKYPAYKRVFIITNYNNFHIETKIYKRIVANEKTSGKRIVIATNIYHKTLEDILKSIKSINSIT